MRLSVFSFRLFLCVGLSIPFISTAAVDNGGWLAAHDMAVRPAVLSGMAEGSLGSRNWFLYQSKAGSRINDTLEFWNKGKKEVKIVVEVADAELLNSGFALSQPGLVGKYIGKWVNFAGQNVVVTVGAGQKRRFPFSIMVPVNVRGGDYWGGVTVREIASGEAKGPANAVWRVGVRVLVRVTRSGTTVRLPQVGFGGVYYPELSLFLRNFLGQTEQVGRSYPVLYLLLVPFYRG